MTIIVEQFGSHIFPEPVFIRRDNLASDMCDCDFNEMHPMRAFNLSMDYHLCMTCGLKIDWDKNDSFNQFFGFSGYDDDERYDSFDEEEDD